jgi:hypothetical protein
MAVAVFRMNNGLEIGLPGGWGQALLFQPEYHYSGEFETARSYNHQGFQLVWVDPSSTAGAMACDIESEGRDCSFMAARFGVSEDEFTCAWVLTEVAAKLAQVPILLWLTQNGLLRPFEEEIIEVPFDFGGDPHRVTLLFLRLENHSLAFGRAFKNDSIQY